MTAKWQWRRIDQVRSRAMKLLLATTVATATLAGLALAPIANADDSAFVAAVNHAGVPVSGNPILAGNVGRQTCAGLQQGWTPSIARGVAQGEYPSMTDSQAATFVNLAITYYCPSISAAH
jgi:hypothetical protein